METYEYRIADHFVSALINGDESGLTDEESRQLADFESSLPKHFHVKTPMHGTWDIEDSEPFFAVCEVCDLHANCLTLTLNFV